MDQDQNEQQSFGRSGVKIQAGLYYLGFLLVATMGILLYIANVS